MSTNNWATCPRCEMEVINKKASQQPMLENSVNRSTLREDYEISIDEGIFSINYVASCWVCNFHYNYKYIESVL